MREESKKKLEFLVRESDRLLDEWEERGAPESPREIDVPVDVDFYHGTRQHISPEEIQKSGLMAFVSEEQGEEEIREALRHFGKEHLLERNYPRKGYCVQSLLHEIRAPHRHQISLTGYEDATHWWSLNAPEFIGLTLLHAGVPRADIGKYLRERYGERYKVKVRYTPTLHDVFGGIGITDVHTHKSYIGPEFIQEVSRFEEDELLDRFRGQGWVRVDKLGSKDVGLIGSIKINYDHPNTREQLGIRLMKRKGIEYFKVL